MPAGLARRNHERTRRDFVDAAMRVMERGEEPTMRAVAAEAGAGERTIYRYFESRDVLHEALLEHLAPRLGVPLCDSVEGLDRYIGDLFDVFDRNRALTVATVTSPWSQPDLARTRTTNLRALTALLAAAFPHVSADDLAAATASLRTVVSGAGWVYQRHSCGLANEAVKANARWLAGTLLERLTALERRARRHTG
jgi:AcrR family transcriptional regulator